MIPDAMAQRDDQTPGPMAERDAQTPGPMAERDAQIRAIGEQYPGWEAWQSLVNQLWHARLIGSTPPVMVHGESPDDLREQIRYQTTGMA
jgi:hypothetical protein